MIFFIILWFRSHLDLEMSEKDYFDRPVAQLQQGLIKSKKNGKIQILLLTFAVRLGSIVKIDILIESGF